jgi:hypothetical protein
MNACQEGQISGNQWPEYNSAMLHRAGRVAPILPEAPQATAMLAGLERQMGDFAAEHEATLLEVRKSYVLPSDSSVVTFLTEHRTVPSLLLEAAPQLRRAFGTATIFNLRTLIEESGSRTLYAVAMWPGTIREVRKALAWFDDAWWIAHSRQASGYLTFTYELV